MHDSINTPSVRTVPREFVELPLNDQVIGQRFAEELDKWLSTAPKWSDGHEAGSFLYSLSMFSTKVTRKIVKGLTKVPRSKRKDGWSPTFVAYKANLDALLEIRRHYKGQHRCKKWRTTADMSIGIIKQINRWCDIVDSLALEYEEKEEALSITTHSPSYWRTIDPTDPTLLATIELDMTKLQTEMHGRKRLEDRKQMKKSVQLREASREMGKVGRVIKSVLGTQSERYTMTFIKTPEGRVVTDEEEIHNMVTAHFNEWFAMPDNASSLHVSESWHEAVDTEEAFVAATAITGVPEPLRREIYPALRAQSYPAANAAMIEKFSEVPSLDEFRAAIASLPTNSASGPTGLTYNMMKRWPLSVIKEAHKALVAQWQEYHIPEWWRWKWLAPLPKTTDTLPALKDLRPLVLLEALRKVWTKIILARITSVWHTHNVIHESQHGSIYRRGTASASLQHINAVEEALELGSELQRSSWDFQRAFDTLSRIVKIISWIRSGLPIEYAEYMVGMDTPGINVVRSPLALETWKTKGYSGFQTNQVLPAYLCKHASSEAAVSTFVAERGTGQGDNPSPSLWAAFLDILARCLASFDIVDSYTVTKVNGDITIVLETMYVDDIESKTATAAGMQHRADIIAAFALIFGIKFSHTKLRRSAMGEVEAEKEETMTIRGPSWTAIEIPIKRDGATNYLGCMTDFNYSGKASKAEMMKIARCNTAAIEGCKASPETKLMVASKSVHAKLGYKAALSTLSLAEYRDIDKILNGMYRRITKNMPTFPTALLYTARKLGGLGIKRLSTITQMAKLKMMLRSLNSGGRQKDTAESLIARAGRMTGVDFASGWANHIDKAPNGKSRAWITSLVEYLREGQLSILRYGDALPVQDQPIGRVIELDDTQNCMLWARGVRVLGDLVRTTAAGSNWSVPTSVNKANWLKKLLPKVVPTGVATIQRGMCWRLSAALDGFKAGDVIEVLGWRNILDVWEINVQRWTGKRNFKPQLKFYGAGTVSWVRWLDVCPTGFIMRIFKNIEGDVINFWM